MHYIRFEKNYIQNSVADFYFGESFTSPEHKLIQFYDLQKLNVFIDSSKFQMLEHKNLL
jgi:hypothetical protein